MDSFRHHDSFRIYLHLLVTLLSKPSRNSERSASVAMPGVRQALLMPWSGGVWRSTHLNAHQSQSLTSVPTGVHPAPTFCKAHSTKLIVSVHGLVAKCFVSKSVQLSFPPTRFILMSPLLMNSFRHHDSVQIYLSAGCNPSYHMVQKSYFTRVKELWSQTQSSNVFRE